MSTMRTHAFLAVPLALLFLFPFITSAAQCPNLTRNLSFGSRGNDVVELQDFLVAQNDLASGNNTGYFGSLTRAAVRKFQCREMNICSGSEATNGYGSVGPKTRVMIASVCAGKIATNLDACKLPLEPRVVSPKKSLQELRAVAASNQVTLKFTEGTGIRLRDGMFINMSISDVTAFGTILNTYGIPMSAVTRAYSRPEADFDAERAKAQCMSGRALADANLYYTISLLEGIPAADLAHSLNALDIVEFAEPSPVSAPLPATSPPTASRATCTAGVKQCPDGSYVGRVAPSCQFAACPVKKEPICSTNYHQFTWSQPQQSGGFRAPILLNDSSLLAARSVVNNDGSYSVQAWKSSNNGVSWSMAGEMARLNDTNDLGDGNFIQLSNGDVLYAVRHHNYTCNNWGCVNQGKSPAQNVFRIEVLKSSDSGASWSYHSTAAVSSGTPWGYWSPHLIQLSNGTLQVYYDDEVTADVQGFTAHQWVVMKTWDVNSNSWVNPVVVSRAPNSTDLSRDGMASIVETSPGHIFVALESVDTAGVHKGVVRTVFSNNYGATWSWQNSSRRIVYQPADHLYNSLQPWLVRLKDNTLALFFTTDEDRTQPGTPANGVESLDLSIKYVLTSDNGVMWSTPVSLSSAHPTLFPGATVFPDGKVFVQYSAGNSYWSIIGTPTTSCGQ